jgi:hypothetical protein
VRLCARKDAERKREEWAILCIRAAADNTRPNKISRASDLGGCGDAVLYVYFSKNIHAKL